MREEKNRKMSAGIDFGTSMLHLAVVGKEESAAGNTDGAGNAGAEAGLHVVIAVRKEHFGRGTAALGELLNELLDAHPEYASLPAVITGEGGEALLEKRRSLPFFGDIPAITEGARALCPEGASVIEIGCQHARFISGIRGQSVPQFAVNEHCAGGTGSFFENQMARLGFRMEEYSDIAEKAERIPRLSGRCAVFAKTDIIHRQQEGAPVPDILLGLCYAMVRNYKAVIVKTLPVEKPVVLLGGIANNRGVVRAIRDIFALKDEELIIPENFEYAAAVGAAVHAGRTADPADPAGQADPAGGRLTLAGLQEFLASAFSGSENLPRTPKLALPENTLLQDPPVSGIAPEEGCALGIDVGSTSTDLVLTDREGKLVDFQYLRTAGEPERVVREGLASIRKRFPGIKIQTVGVTGSGRQRIGELVGADAIRDEITAQARAAVEADPAADTVFEIGGQDSKFISLKNGNVADFQMNKICAAGTGSFVEEQAAHMGIPLQDFGTLALRAEQPVDLGERCTVFIETAIASAFSQGAETSDIAAGICQSIVSNYLHKVVGNKTVGDHIVLQGGVAYNPGIVAAFRGYCGDRLQVSPVFSISGSYGAALLAIEKQWGKSSFRGFEFPSSAEKREGVRSGKIRENIQFYRRSHDLLYRGYDRHRDPEKKTVGVPMVLMLHKFFPMVQTYLKELGFNVLVSRETDEETIARAQQKARGETCYPVKLIYGHMQELAEAGVDYIFIPSIHTMKHARTRVAHNYGCVYMQTAPKLVARALGLEKQGIRLINPVFDLDFGKLSLAPAMIQAGVQLGKTREECQTALQKASGVFQKFDKDVEEEGKKLLAGLKPDEKVLVLITRNYGIGDPVLNMGIPELLMERGCKVITLSHLPAHDADITDEYPNLYWPFGQHIISGAKIVRHHPNLYAVYLTNHGCGPDTMLQHLFAREMQGKPYLQIEVDEHFSKVGVITRIEAFLNSLEQYPAEPLPENFDILDIPVRQDPVLRAPAAGTVFLREMGMYSRYLAEYLRRACGVRTEILPAVGNGVLDRGRTETSSKEYLPFVAALGEVLTLAERDPAAYAGSSGKDPAAYAGIPQYLLPASEGSDADGLYARTIASVLEQRGATDRVRLAAPILETLYKRAKDPELLFRAVLTADLLMAAPAALREQLAPAEIPDAAGLLSLAAQIGTIPRTGIRLLAAGAPEILFSLDQGIFGTLEKEGYQIRYAPLSEYLLMMWEDARKEELKRNLANKMLRMQAQLQGQPGQMPAGSPGGMKPGMPGAGGQGGMKPGMPGGPAAILAAEQPDPEFGPEFAKWENFLKETAARLGAAGSFSGSVSDLRGIADRALPGFAGAGGRYRFAKAETFRDAEAMLLLAPRYENTAMVLELQGNETPLPVYRISLDHDWDEAGWSALRSFLYYVGKRFGKCCSCNR